MGSKVKTVETTEKFFQEIGSYAAVNVRLKFCGDDWSVTVEQARPDNMGDSRLHFDLGQYENLRDLVAWRDALTHAVALVDEAQAARAARSSTQDGGSDEK
jgi:hypothetical protein